MYRSLAELVAGWSKNLLMGGLQTMPRWIRPFVAPASLVGGVGLWLVPPVSLVAGLAGAGPERLLAWSAWACGLSAVVWMAFTHKMRGPPLYGLLYPLGALVGAYIFVRSWVRGRDVEWKGTALPAAPGLHAALSSWAPARR